MSDDNRGPLIAVLDNGIEIYQRGIVNSTGYVEVNLAVYNFSAEYNFNSGTWVNNNASLVQQVPKGGSIEIFAENNGDVGIEAVGSLGVVQLGIVVAEDGTVSEVVGIGGGTNWLGLGTGIVVREGENPSNLSTYDSITLFPDGSSFRTTHLPGDSDHPYVKVLIRHTDAEGNFETYTTNIADPNVAAAMSAGTAPRRSNQCFLAGTLITMADGSQKPIENIAVGDLVASYNDKGELKSRPVTRLFQNNVHHILDVHGLKVTPGHVTLCGEGMFKDKHVPIIDILLSDGALVREDGSLVRVAINKPVGSLEDKFVEVEYAETAEDAAVGKFKEGRIRVGTLLFDREDGPVSVLDCIKSNDMIFDPVSGLVCIQGGAPKPLCFVGELPRPEDYILRRSHETLDGILTHGEWEGTPSMLAASRLRETMGLQSH